MSAHTRATSSRRPPEHCTTQDLDGVRQRGFERARHLMGDGELAGHQQMQHRFPASGLGEIDAAALAFDRLGRPAHGQGHRHIGEKRGQSVRQRPADDDGEDRCGGVGSAVQGEQQGGVRALVESEGAAAESRQLLHALGGQREGRGAREVRGAGHAAQDGAVTVEQTGPAAGPPRHPAQQLR
ncbi:hypothetical protein [Streptomyces sp. LN500]|uniref:hypothetical protein n=1 Tax=Streptomyces sp. LN500 TaxID=3112978 RepID=UPI0037211A76